MCRLLAVHLSFTIFSYKGEAVPDLPVYALGAGGLNVLFIVKFDNSLMTISISHALEKNKAYLISTA